MDRIERVSRICVVEYLSFSVARREMEEADVVSCWVSNERKLLIVLTYLHVVTT